jgi:hypothetical protein
MASLNTNGFGLPVYIVKGVYTSGHVADLGPLQLGIFDKKTNSVATASGNGKEFYLAGGSPHTKDVLTKFFKGMKGRKESTPFLGKDLKAFDKVLPSRASNEAWVIGYDGSKGSNSLAFEADKTYKLLIRLWGEPAYRRNGHASVEKVIPLHTGCSSLDDCDTSCGPEYVGVKKQVKAWVKAINEHPDLSDFKLKARPIFSDYAATSATLHDYTLTITDDGSANALQSVQRSYLGKEITRGSYLNGVSVYRLKSQSGAPADYTSKSYSFPVTNCDECAQGTFQDSRYTYIVRRPVAAGTDLDDQAAIDTYAASIVTAYTGLAGTGAFYGLDKGNAVVKFNSVNPKTRINSDELEQIAFTAPICTSVAGVTTAWVVGTGSYTVTRTLTATFTNEDCENAVSVAEAQAFFNAQLKNPTVVSDITDTVGTGIDADNCTTVLQVVQTSFPMADEYCMTSDNAEFEEIPSYKGENFVEVDVPESYNAAIKAGIRLTAPFYSVEFGDCSYDKDERWDNQPLRMEVSILDDELNLCKLSTYAKARRVKAPTYERLSGKYVRKEYIDCNSEYFVYEKWALSPRDRELIDNNVQSQIKTDEYYVMYQLHYKEARDGDNQKKQNWAPIFFIKESDLATQTAFENAIQSVSGKFGVGLHNRIPV